MRWVSKGDRVLLVNMDYSLVADPSNPVAMAVDDANYPAIIRAFNVAAYSPAGDPVDRRHAALHDRRAGVLGARPRSAGAATDGSRSFLEKVVSFPENINVEVTQTFTAGDTRRRRRPVAAERPGARDARLQRNGR